MKNKRKSVGDNLSYLWISLRDGFRDTYFDTQKNMTSFKKIKMVSFSLLFTFLIASFFILLKGENPILVFRLIWSGATSTKEQLNQTLLNTAMYIAVGIGIIISFKAGLFNVGITGQLYLGGSIALLVGVTTGAHWALLLIIAILSAIVLGALGGILKAFFNIHEVVATILLNWIAYFFVRYLFRPGQSFMGTTSSQELKGASIMAFGDSNWQPALLIAVMLLITYWFIINKTTLGFSLKSIGLNKEASKYGGMNIKAKIVLAMVLSSIGAGILGAIMFLGKDKVYSVPTTISLPGEGFDGVAVALVAFNSPIGLVPISFLWAILKIGSDQVPIFTEVPKELINLISGIIMYSVAISAIFLRFKPITSLRRAHFYWTNDKAILERNKYKKAIRSQKNSSPENLKTFSESYRGKIDINKKYYFEIRNIEKDIKKIANQDITISEYFKIYSFKILYSFMSIKIFKYNASNFANQQQDKIEKLIRKRDHLIRQKNIELDEIISKTKKHSNREFSKDRRILRDIKKERINNLISKDNNSNIFEKVISFYRNRKIIYDKYTEKKSEIEIEYILSKIEIDAKIKSSIDKTEVKQLKETRRGLYIGKKSQIMALNDKKGDEKW